MRKSRIAIVVVSVMTFGLLGGAVFADYGCKDGRECAKGKGGSQCAKEKGDSQRGKDKDCLEAKFCAKAQFLMKNQEELGLSDDQVAKIKDVKANNKKDMIKRDAEIEILALDIKSALYAETIDTEVLNTLIDKKYDLKKEKTKALVGAYAALKEIPTKEQKEKMKALWKKCEKEKGE